MEISADVLRILAAFLIALLTIGGAHAQVQKTGPITPGHAAKWYSNNVIGDAGPAAGATVLNGPYLTELGITATGTPLCVTDTLTNSAGGYHQLCFAALTTIGSKTGAFITYNNYGAASADSLYFNINGTTYSFPYTVGGIVGPSSSTVSDVACWNNVTGSLLYDCGAFPTQSAQNPNLVLAGPTSGSAATPTFRALVGADLPNPSSSSLGGIESIIQTSHNWVQYIDTSGVPHLAQPSYSDLSGSPPSPSIAGAASGFVNKLRGTTLSQWYSGTSGTIPTSFGTSAWTAEGVPCAATGATGTWSRIANPLTSPLSYYSLKLLGASSVTAMTCRFVIESYDAAPLAGQTVTFQIPIQNVSGGAVVATITTKYPSAQDNWTSASTDLASTNLQSCANNATCTLAYTFPVNAGANNGYEVIVNFGALGSGAYVVVGGGFDLRATPSATVGLNSSPPTPEIYTVGRDTTWCQRFYQTTYDNGSAPGTATHNGMVGSNAYNGANTFAVSIPFAIIMRAIPGTVTFYDGAGTSGKSSEYVVGSGWSDGLTANTILQTSTKGLIVYPPGVYYGAVEHYTADARIIGG